MFFYTATTPQMGSVTFISKKMELVNSVQILAKAIGISLSTYRMQKQN